MTAAALTLALDVDGVLLDPERAGDGHWTNELDRRYGITRPQLREAFFVPSWDDVVNGRRSIESALEQALREIGVDVDVEDVLACWFEADFVVVEAAIELVCRAVGAGCRVALATNQEHRRAAYLSEHLGRRFRIDDVLYSADLGVQKHEPEFFVLASDRLGVPRGARSQILFVDDLDHNVAQARAAGWSAVHARDDGEWIAEVDRALR